MHSLNHILEHIKNHQYKIFDYLQEKFLRVLHLFWINLISRLKLGEFFQFNNEYTCEQVKWLKALQQRLNTTIKRDREKEFKREKERKREKEGKQMKYFYWNCK